jgi:ATP-dependent DNA helicase 2 subunit 2
VRGYRYGPQYIPMAGLDENILKLVSEPVLRLLGCVPVSSIARQHFLSSSFVVGVATGDSNDGARRAVGSLSQALQRLKQAALCRLVKRANADPWLVVLLPNSDGTLLMHRLPCSEDIRNFMFPPLTSMASVAPLQKQAVAAAVDSMTISALQSDDLLMVNPAFMAFLSHVQENAKTIDGPLPGIQTYDDTFKSLGEC